MNFTASPEQVRESVARSISHSTDVDDMLAGVAAEVAKAVPYDGGMWFGVDPATMMAVAPARLESLDGGFCQPFWNNEFHEQDAILFRDLANRPRDTAATLRDEIGDLLQRSARYRDFLEPQGYAEELRAVFRSGGRTWGVVALFRDRGREPFDAHAVSVLSAISSVVADALRTHATVTVAPTGLVHSPGLMLFDDTATVLSVNDSASQWLEDLFGRGTDWVAQLSDPERLDTNPAVPLIPLLSKARAVAAGRDRGDARARIRDRSGRWVVLHASVLGGGERGPIAVIVEPAKSADIAPIVVEAYGLTPRERDVVRSIATGSSTPQIADELFLSAHTVRDHIKSVFDKIGVTSRSELVAKLFADHYIDPFHEQMVTVD